MQQREKILLVLLVGVLIFWWGRPILLSSFITPLEEREAELKTANSKLELRQVEQDKVLNDARLLKIWQEESLPADPYAAQREYTRWITDQLEKAGWSTHKVTPGKVNRLAKIGSTIQVQVEGIATSASLSRFLNAFTNAPILQRMERVSIAGRSIQPGAEMDVTFMAEAVGLKTAKREEIPISESTELIAAWEQFANESPFTLPTPKRTFQPRMQWPPSLVFAPGTRATVPVNLIDVPVPSATKIQLGESAPEAVAFNPETRQITWEIPDDLAPGKYPVPVTASWGAPQQSIKSELVLEVRLPNDAPRFGPIQPPVAYPNVPWKLQVSATDSDMPQQTLRFQLLSGAPPSMRIDPQSGLISWTPGGDLVGKSASVEVAVSDSGIPSKQTTTRISIPVDRNAEVSTQLVGCVMADENWTAWFRDKETGDRFQLRLNEKLNAGAYTATVEKIEVNRVILRTETGANSLSVGDMLTERYRVDEI